MSVTEVVLGSYLDGKSKLLNYMNEKCPGEKDKDYCIAETILFNISPLIEDSIFCITSVADLILGSLSAVLSFLPLGESRKTCAKFSNENLFKVGAFFSYLFSSVLKNIGLKRIVLSQEFESSDQGFFTEKVCQKIKDIYAEPGIIKRIKHLVAIPCFVVTRILDFVLGVFAAAAALSTFGYFPELNVFAFENFKVLHVIGDVLSQFRACVWCESAKLEVERS
jgi:hypothetical protein